MSMDVSAVSSAMTRMFLGGEGPSFLLHGSEEWQVDFE